MTNKTITVETVVDASIDKVWSAWTEPQHITKWAFASSDWEAPKAENDLRTGGKFMTRMQAKDGSSGFDFGGTYTLVEKPHIIEYDMDAAPNHAPRHVKIEFLPDGDGVKITQAFDAESENPIEMQRAGWQAIMSNFKKYVESQ